jgi:hypothetical protein
LIVIDNILVSDRLVEEQFVCDLLKCKGGCCEDGDAGAPLEEAEMRTLKNIYPVVKPYLTKEGIREIEANGLYNYEREFGWVTPTIGTKMCAYGFRDGKGVIKCGIEQAWMEGKTDWKKPISCHLYPAKISHTKEHELINYEPRDPMCSPACNLGKREKVPAFVFLKEALTRKFGKDFYAALEQAAQRQSANRRPEEDRHRTLQQPLEDQHPATAHPAIARPATTRYRGNHQKNGQ